MTDPETSRRAPAHWLQPLAALAVAGSIGVAVMALAAGPAGAPSPAAIPALPSAPPSHETVAAAVRVAAPGGSLDEILGAALLDSSSHRYVVRRPDGERVPLTLVPQLQRDLERLLSTYKAPLAQIVAIEPATGRLLAVARDVAQGPEGAGLAAQGAYPAASVFKLVTAAALLARGVPPDVEICYHGGKHRLRAGLLADDGRRDRRCLSLADAVAHSANVAIAKLARRNLDQMLLRDWASRFLFDAPLPLEAATEMSRAPVPKDPFAFAATAAGFGEVTMSPLHGASIAAAIANDGTLAPLRIIDDAREPAAPRQILTPELARELTTMMERTVREGTAHKAFRTRLARSLDAAGKTGSIASRHPFHDYSWFVGFAPALSPKIAVAVLVVNGLKWRVHASTLAESAMGLYLHPPRAQRAQASR
ncbi:MAG: penicillin-binding transpeptidase domain-containing protein [Deltaproteobacteria bacterium]